MNKVLVKLYVPYMEKQFDVWIPLNKKIYNVIMLITKAIFEMSRENIKLEKVPTLYNKATAEVYDVNMTVKESSIRNGTELILI